MLMKENLIIEIKYHGVKNIILALGGNSCSIFYLQRPFFKILAMNAWTVLLGPTLWCWEAQP